MPRYIDAEKLSREVISSWDKDKHVTLEASRVHRQEHHHLMRIIEKQPTADVVPSAEVEQLKRNLEQCENGYRQQMHILQCKLTKATSGAEKLNKELDELAEEHSDLII